MYLKVDFIREILSKKGWSMRKVALKSGLSSATVSRILNKKRGVGARAIAGLMKEFPEYSMDELFFLPVSYH